MTVYEGGVAKNPGCRTSCARCHLKQEQFYVCPGDGRTKSEEWQCGGIDRYYCEAWGCETTGDAYWHPTSSWDLIAVKKSPTIDDTNPLDITFTEKGKQYRRWVSGRIWGLRYYIYGWDRGLTFKVRLKVETPTPVPVGSNPVLADQRSPPPPSPVPPRKALAAVTSTPALTAPQRAPGKAQGTGQRLLNLIQGAFTLLNSSSPDTTRSCWLCLSSSPPYYEGIAFTGNFTNTTNSSFCLWGVRGD